MVKYLYQIRLRRMGVQPVVTLRANGSDCVHVKVGEEVSFEAIAQVPQGGGKITHIDFSFEGEEDYPYKGEVIDHNEEEYHAISKMVHIYHSPGTYFAVAKVKSNLVGDGDDIFTQIQNLSRVRVVVE